MGDHEKPSNILLLLPFFACTSYPELALKYKRLPEQGPWAWEMPSESFAIWWLRYHVQPAGSDIGTTAAAAAKCSNLQRLCYKSNTWSNDQSTCELPNVVNDNVAASHDYPINCNQSNYQNSGSFKESPSSTIGLIISWTSAEMLLISPNKCPWNSRDVQSNSSGQPSSLPLRWSMVPLLIVFHHQLQSIQTRRKTWKKTIITWMILVRRRSTMSDVNIRMIGWHPKCFAFFPFWVR